MAVVDPSVVFNSEFQAGRRVRIKAENPNGTHRTPEYIRGKIGIIEKAHGIVPGFEIDHREDWGPLYTIVFETREIADVNGRDKILVDVHEDWLESI